MTVVAELLLLLALPSLSAAVKRRASDSSKWLLEANRTHLGVTGGTAGVHDGAQVLGLGRGCRNVQGGETKTVGTSG